MSIFWLRHEVLFTTAWAAPNDLCIYHLYDFPNQEDHSEFNSLCSWMTHQAEEQYQADKEIYDQKDCDSLFWSSEITERQNIQSVTE